MNNPKNPDDYQLGLPDVDDDTSGRLISPAEYAQMLFKQKTPIDEGRQRWDAYIAKMVPDIQSSVRSSDSSDATAFDREQHDRGLFYNADGTWSRGGE